MAALFRAVHTLKGAAYVVGCTPMGAVAHGVEDLLVAVRAGRLDVTPGALEEVHAAVDLAKRMLDPAAEPALDFTRAADAGARAPRPSAGRGAGAGCAPRWSRRSSPLAPAEPEPLEAAAVVDSGVTVVPAAPSASSTRRGPRADAAWDARPSASRSIVSTR